MTWERVIIPHKAKERRRQKQRGFSRSLSFTRISQTPSLLFLFSPFEMDEEIDERHSSLSPLLSSPLSCLRSMREREAPTKTQLPPDSPSMVQAILGLETSAMMNYLFSYMQPNNLLVSPLTHHLQFGPPKQRRLFSSESWPALINDSRSKPLPHFL